MAFPPKLFPRLCVRYLIALRLIEVESWIVVGEVSWEAGGFEGLVGAVWAVWARGEILRCLVLLGLLAVCGCGPHVGHVRFFFKLFSIYWILDRKVKYRLILMFLRVFSVDFG